MFFNIARSLMGGSASLLQQPSLIITRGMQKTHKGAAKRFFLIDGGYARGQPGRRHGNAGWSKQMLRKLDRRAVAKGKGEGNHKNRLKKLLPFW